MLPLQHPEIIDKILEMGREQMPLEACGVIRPDGVVVRTTNFADDPERAFRIDPIDVATVITDYIATDPEDEPRPKDFIIWHTHPSGSEGPSQFDMEAKLAPVPGEPGFQYVVVTMPDGPAVFY